MADNKTGSNKNTNTWSSNGRPNGDNELTRSQRQALAVEEIWKERQQEQRQK